MDCGLMSFLLSFRRKIETEYRSPCTGLAGVDLVGERAFALRLHDGPPSKPLMPPPEALPSLIVTAVKK